MKRSCTPSCSDTNMRASAVLAGHPENVPAGLRIEKAGGDEQEVREAIDVFERGRADRFVFRRGEFRHQPLGPAADGAGEMQMRRRGRSPWQHEGAQGAEALVHPV